MLKRYLTAGTIFVILGLPLTWLVVFSEHWEFWLIVFAAYGFVGGVLGTVYALFGGKRQ